MPIPASHADILDKRAFCHISTLMPDGSPQASPVWVDRHDGHVRVNSAVGRRKDKNIVADPRVALSVTDPDNPYRAMMLRGRVVERTFDGADEHIDALAHKYMGVDKYPFRAPGEQRVIYVIAVERASAMGQ